MWILGQLFEVLLVVAGLNILWTIIRAPFVAREPRIIQAQPEDLVALQRAANEAYTRRIRESLEARAAAVKAG